MLATEVAWVVVYYNAQRLSVCTVAYPGGPKIGYTDFPEARAKTTIS